MDEARQTAKQIAYDDGWNSYMDGLDRDSNPHAGQDAELEALWRDGWNDAHFEEEGEGDYHDDGFDDDDRFMFADPGGVSALRAETPDNPRNLPCPTCGTPNRLTPADKALGYQCDSCADRAERGLDYYG